MQSIIMILNLFILEALLSVDNAAVLAVLVKDLPPADSNKALRYGIWGAYILRGVCLLFAGLLIAFWPLKIVGGAYLCYLYYGHLNSTPVDEVKRERRQSPIYKWVRATTGLNDLWATIVLVELMDLTFSMDNIFASVALSTSWWVILLGVGFGIAAMRFVAGWFVKLMGKYPSLENSSYIVILCLGVKLIITGLLGRFITFGHTFDMVFSLAMMAIFALPFIKIKSYFEREG